MGVPKSSILIGFSSINSPFLGYPIDGNPHVVHRYRHRRSPPGRNVWAPCNALHSAVPRCRADFRVSPRVMW